MALINWTTQMSVGIDTIDNQHKKLLNILNELFEAMRSGHAKDALDPILNELVQYTKGHFAFEEDLFAKTEYPDSSAHKLEHADLIQQVASAQKKFQEGAGSTLSLEVMNFLKNWLTNHIQGTDKRYSAYLIAKGVH